MRILVTTPYFWPATRFGGPTYSILNSALALRAAGASVRVLTTTADVGGHLGVTPSTWMDVQGVPTWYEPAEGYGEGRPPSSFNWCPGFRRRVESFGAESDIILRRGNFTYPALSSARGARQLGIPYVVIPHGGLGQWAMHHKRLKKRVYWALFERTNLRHAAAVFYTSQKERSEAAHLGLQVPGLVFPNITHLEPFSPAQALDLRARLTQSESDRLILFCGRIHPVKGLDLLLRALALAVASSPNVKLAIAGTGLPSHEAACRRLAWELGVSHNVHFLGHVEGRAKAALFAAADVFCLPSHHENFGMVVAEAMLSQLPVVISSNVGVWPDVVGARCGLVCEMRPESIASCLRDLLNEDSSTRRKRGAAGKAWAERHYAAHHVGKQMLLALDSILRGSALYDRPADTVAGPLHSAEL